MVENKILVVDDDLAILDVVGLVLEGYTIDLLSKGDEIFEHIFNFHPDLIILDVMLGELDGRILCNRIKQAKDTSHIPIIMISASHNMKHIISKSCNPDDFIEKPFDIYNLVSKVQSRLSASRFLSTFK